MADLLDRFGVIVPVIAIASVVILTTINLYFKIRRKFPATVNCWFCNQCTSVPYKQINCWTCPHCDQYNGFSEDGDYNCEIPAQRIAKLNGPSCVIRQKDVNGAVRGPRITNGLCEPCNRNQEIKIQQLATFIPDDESSFDEEIEEFRKKLEQAYRLCYRCERILKRELNKVKRNVLGSKLAQISSRGLSIFDQHMSNTSRLIASKKKQLFTHLVLVILVILSTLNFLRLSENVELTKPKMDLVFHPTVTHVALVALSYISAFHLLISKIQISLMAEIGKLYSVGWAFISPMPPISLISSLSVWPEIKESLAELLEVNSQLIIDLIALYLTTIVLLLNGFSRTNGSVVFLLLWSLKMILPTVQENLTQPMNNIIVDGLKVSISILLFFISIINIRSNNQLDKLATQGKRNISDSFHRIYSECNSDGEEESDVDSEYLSSSRVSSLKSRKLSPGILNHSLNSTKSMSPSNLSSSVKHNMSDTLNSSFRSNILHTDRFGGSQESLFGTNRSSVSCRNGFELKNPIKNMSHDSIHLMPKYFESDSTKRFNSMTNGLNSYNTDLFQKGLCELNLSNANGINSVPLLRQRKQLISPARLELNQTVLGQPLTQASWVAGGYWNSTSPTKRPNVLTTKQCTTDELDPILSRTSSQSSGFESRASSMINGCDNRSRESSICPELDRNSVFSEFPESASQINNGSILNTTFNLESNRDGQMNRSQLDLTRMTNSPTFQMPQNRFATIDKRSFEHLDVFGAVKPVNGVEQTIYSQPIRLQQNTPWQQQVKQLQLHRRQCCQLNRAASCSFNFKKFTNDLPPIEKGDLLKSWKQNSLLNLSQNL